MKTYKNRFRRPNLLAVPYSVRPDRIERGLRVLRALRHSLAALPTPAVRPEQREFDFVLAQRA